MSSNRAVELVNTYPDLKGIIVPAGMSLLGAATALADSGDLERVKSLAACDITGAEGDKVDAGMLASSPSERMVK